MRVDLEPHGVGIERIVILGHQRSDNLGLVGLRAVLLIEHLKDVLIVRLAVTGAGLIAPG